ncbi:MFS transporter [Dietzia sp. PP-33]|uniref:MFS transporter n=1 Tax=Dietzia sp. PP-33 TaxID=2957500 RepID=UPI0029BB75BE|nr:MFS transporter [Dietzia sp. PP-33]MDX2358552.1 MFS transporter [Dietzia sp. PP-33]
MRLLPATYLASCTLSALGNSIAAIVLPLLVLQTTGSALAAGTVAAATIVPAVVAGIFMGLVIDRINRRTSSILTDLISAAAMGALPIIDMITGLSVGWFILCGVIGAVGDVPGITAREALLPAIIRHSGVSAERITGSREALGAVAILIGPAAAGFMVTIWGGATALWVTAGASLAAALLTMLIPDRVGTLDGVVTASGGQPRRVWGQLREGWMEMISNRFVLVTSVLTVAAVVAIGGLQGIILPLYFTEIDRPGLLGLVLSAIAAGSLVGGGIYAVAGTRGSRRHWFVAGVVGSIIGLGIMATLVSVWVLFLGAFVLGFSVGLFGALIGVLSIERIPEDRRGRVLGTQNTLVTAGSPLGIFLAGLLTELTDLHTALVMLAALWSLGLLVALFARSMRNLDRPAAVDPDREVMSDA